LYAMYSSFLRYYLSDRLSTCDCAPKRAGTPEGHEDVRPQQILKYHITNRTLQEMAGKFILRHGSKDAALKLLASLR
jgi:hypothetical protein